MCISDYSDEPFEVSINKRDRVALLKWPDGSRRVVPLPVFRIEVERAVKALLNLDADHKVISFGGH